MQPTAQEVEDNIIFNNDLKAGDEVDALKVDLYSKRACWSRAKVVKTTYTYIMVEYLMDKPLNDKKI